MITNASIEVLSHLLSARNLCAVDGKVILYTVNDHDLSTAIYLQAVQL